MFHTMGYDRVGCNTIPYDTIRSVTSRTMRYLDTILRYDSEEKRKGEEKRTEGEEKTTGRDETRSVEPGRADSALP